MRWTKWLLTSSRVAQAAQMVVAFALAIVAEPGVEMVLNGVKWT